MQYHPPYQRREVIGLILAALAAPSLAAPAPVRDTAETMHGVKVHDPYRYMENVKDPEVQAWLKDQGAKARDALEHIAGRDAMLKRVDELSAATGDSLGNIVRIPGGRVFYTRRGRTDTQYKLVMKENGVERVIADPAAEAKKTGVPHAINYFMPSWDGRYVAFGMSAGGSEDASLYIVEAATGKRIGAPIPRVPEPNVSWLPDSQSFTYNQLRQLNAEDAETEFYLDSKVMWLKLGAPESEARAVFGPTVNRQLGLVRLDVGSLTFTPGSPWVVARTTDTTLPEGSLFIARVSDFGKGEIPWKQISKFDDRIVDIELAGNELFFRTHQGAPRYKVMKLDLRQPDLKRAVDVALPPEKGVLEGFEIGRGGALMASVREGQQIGLREYAPGDRIGRKVKLPFAGAASVESDPAHVHGDWLFRVAGWTHPPRVMLLSGGVVKDAGFPAARRPEGVPELEVTDVTFRSWDGAMVPMTIIHRKGLKRDGTHPTLLEGYGCYGFSETAHYDATAYAWYERGGVLAYVNVRGSGVYGEPWRLAGFKATKSNTWKDGVAATQYLIAQGYASPKTMSILGGSGGGIFVGRAVTTAPQLYAAAIFMVPVMDAVRAEESANGITNISEFGSYKNAAEFPALLEMSTYHQVRDGTPYPAVLFVHGMNDPRVDLWQSAKAAARFQAATSSGKPILLRLDAQAGHGIGSTAAQRNSTKADMYSFLLWQMGMHARSG